MLCKDGLLSTFVYVYTTGWKLSNINIFNSGIFLVIPNLVFSYKPNIIDLIYIYIYMCVCVCVYKFQKSLFLVYN